MPRWLLLPILVLLGPIESDQGRALWAEPPRKISEFVTPAELESELETRFAELEPFLESDDAFAENKKRLQQVVSLLAVAAQALADHTDDSPQKPFAPDFRDAVMQIARAETLATAKAGHVAAQAAWNGTSSKAAAVEFDWAKLAKQRPLMEDIENRMQLLQRALRRPKDAAKESQLAAVLAVANIPTLVDTHEVKDPAQLPEWNKLSLQMLDQLRAVSVAIKSKEPMEAQAQFKAARATCIECHRQFKKEF